MPAIDGAILADLNHADRDRYQRGNTAFQVWQETAADQDIANVVIQLLSSLSDNLELRYSTRYGRARELLEMAKLTKEGLRIVVATSQDWPDEVKNALLAVLPHEMQRHVYSSPKTETSLPETRPPLKESKVEHPIDNHQPASQVAQDEPDEQSAVPAPDSLDLNIEEPLEDDVHELKSSHVATTEVTPKSQKRKSAVESEYAAGGWWWRLAGIAIAILAVIVVFQQFNKSDENIKLPNVLAKEKVDTTTKPVSAPQAKKVDEEPTNVAARDPISPAVEAIAGLGGKVQRDDQQKVVYVWLTNKFVADSNLHHLRELVDLQELWLGSTKINGSGLRHLNRLENLRTIDLGGCSDLEDAGLKHLARLPNLTELWLWECSKITDRGLAELSGLRKLKTIDIRKTGVTAAGIEKLKRALPNCNIIQ